MRNLLLGLCLCLTSLLSAQTGNNQYSEACYKSGHLFIETPYSSAMLECEVREKYEMKGCYLNYTFFHQGIGVAQIADGELILYNTHLYWGQPTQSSK
jgi:hypothetical protein